MKVCFFGSYDPNYARNRIIKKGLKANGVKVYKCQASGLIFSRYIKLVKCFIKYKNQCNSIIVGFPGHYDVPLAFILGKFFGKKVYYDIFASTYETYVLDRQVVSKNSLRAKFFYFVDWLGLKLADYVIVDTFAHGKFYNQLYGLIKVQKQIAVYVGSDTDYFYPRKVKEETDVLFYGSYQPLQGTDVIVKAASFLPKVKFKLIGDGQTKKSSEDLTRSLNLKNVEFINWVPLNKLAVEISKAKITLGVFGTSQKANIVIPNKVFDSIACRKLVVTANTGAIRELFTEGDNIILVKKESPIEISKTIARLLKNKTLKNHIASNAYNLYNSNLKPELVVRPLLKYLNE